MEQVITYSPVLYAAQRKRDWLQQHAEMLANIEEEPESQLALSLLLTIQKIYKARAERTLPHPDGDEVDRVVEEWAKEHGMWFPDQEDGVNPSAEVNEMNKYLGRFAINKERLILTGKIYMILFYIDDTIANEFQKRLSDEDRKVFGAFMFNFLKSIETGQRSQVLAPPMFAKLEEGMYQCIDELREHFKDDPTNWLGRFIQALKSHLQYAVQDHNTAATGEIMPTDRFFWFRNEVSGMRVSNLLAEYLLDTYIDAEQEDEQDFLIQSLKRADYLAALLAGLFNDGFSLEKEGVDAEDEFNFFMNLMLNNPELTLPQAIVRGCEMINVFVEEFFAIGPAIEKEINARKEAQQDLTMPEKVIKLCSAFEDEVFAAWIWQIYTKRYLRKKSVFVETTEKEQAFRDALLMMK